MGRVGKNQTLKRHYYDPSRPGAYGGVFKHPEIGTKKIKEWLSHQDTYTLHKPLRRRFQRRATITGGINHQFQADLIDMRMLRKYNGGASYLVTCIDVFSKFAWAIPIKKKTGKALAEAVRKIFTTRKPINFQTDKGSEFVNKTFLKFLKDEGVHFFTTENEDIKAAIVERFNRTLKEKMWRYFTKTNRLRYIDVVDDLITNYNHSYHRSIRMAPVNVNLSNQERVWNTLYEHGDITYRKVFNEGDRVRIGQSRNTFKKGYTPSWTEELFTVSRVNATTPVTYVLKDDSGEEVKGSFYKEELQKVGDKKVYRVEQIIQERKGVGGKEYLVKWFGYNPSFNSWISARDISKYKD
jgi:transposase InsO family protein